ncbi:histidine kinase dimerization/phosphoacceptor domain -containing protein [Flavobacterium nackdongense]|uniref:histidine kinase n=1 Tax=Flavobacterium nackdongense TaxID=2547394 RepID=A0A4P6Y6I8_9FLAO|nr:histidine kinase dimerization/phosphoacceptor domain -containing protein [Flavobacterium nackdongense]QBN17976.1 histidine kinase [Flavobacterium nackdongense]
MNKILVYLLLTIICNGYAQHYSEEATSDSSLQWSKKYQNKALYFLKIPQYNRDSSAYYFEKATKLVQSNSEAHYEQLATIYLQKADVLTCNYTLSQLDSLSRIGWYYLKKIPVQQNKLLEYDFLINWASIKLELGEHKKSLLLFSNALRLAEDFKSPELVAKILMNKGVYYERYQLVEEEKLSLENLYKSLSYYQKWGESKKPTALFSIYRSIISYHTDKNSDSVYYYFDKMKRVLKYSKNPIVPAWYYVCLGRELITSPVAGQKTISQKQYDEGKKNIIKALNILEHYKIKTSSITAYGYGLLADLYLHNKQYDLAIGYYVKSRNDYLRLKNLSAAESMTQYIGQAYQLKGDLANALIYFKQYYLLSSIFQKEKNERGLRENELQINLLQQEKKLIQKQKQQTIYIIALLTIVILLIWFYRNYQLKQKSNQQLAALNNDLANKNNLLDKKNAENELLLKEIHHRVKNNLLVISSLLELQSEQIDDPKIKEAIKDGQNRVNSIGIVHRKLYQYDNVGFIDMKEYVMSLSESILGGFGTEGLINLELQVEKFDLEIDTAIPVGLIINELLTNALKYAFRPGEKGTIIIKLVRQNNALLHLQVADNGIGKSDAIQGTGFGGQLIALLTNQLNGRMKEVIQNGTTISFDFKL